VIKVMIIIISRHSLFFNNNQKKSFYSQIKVIVDSYKMFR